MSKKRGSAPEIVRAIALRDSHTNAACASLRGISALISLGEGSAVLAITWTSETRVIFAEADFRRETDSRKCGTHSHAESILRCAHFRPDASAASVTAIPGVNQTDGKGALAGRARFS
jgi:hypothetical protein